MSEWVVLPLILVLVCYYAWKWIWHATVPSRIKVTATLSEPSIQWGAQTQLSITIVSASLLPVPALALQMDLPIGVMAMSEDGGKWERLASRTWLRPRQTVTLSFKVGGQKRGVFRLDNVRLDLSDGLAGTVTLYLPVAAELIVHPRVFSCGTVATRQSLRIGRQDALDKLIAMGQDWVDVKPYEAGDQIRDIAWTLSARKNTLLTLQRTVLRDRQLVLVVSAQTHMPYWRGTQSAMVEAVYEQAVALAHVLLRDNYALHIHANAVLAKTNAYQRVIQLSGESNRKNLWRLGHAFGRLPINALSDIRQTLERVVALHRQSVIFLLTAYVDEDLRKVVHQLQARGHRMHVVEIAKE